MKKSIARTLLNATIAATFATCAAPSLAQVKVGVIEGLSGPPALIDFGESYLQGIKLALKDYEAAGGKTKIELVIYDDEANPQRAVSLTQRLLQNDKVPVVIGTVASGNVLAMAPIMQKAGVAARGGPEHRHQHHGGFHQRKAELYLPLLDGREIPD